MQSVRSPAIHCVHGHRPQTPVRVYACPDRWPSVLQTFHTITSSSAEHTQSQTVGPARVCTTTCVGSQAPPRAQISPLRRAHPRPPISCNLLCKHCVQGKTPLLLCACTSTCIYNDPCVRSRTITPAHTNISRTPHTRPLARTHPHTPTRSPPRIHHHRSPT